MRPGFCRAAALPCGAPASLESESIRLVCQTILVRILGIESSCDETAAAVVKDGQTILSSIVASQLSTHGKYGGVVPELASREHLRAIVPVVREAMERSGSQWDDLAAIATTVGPGAPSVATHATTVAPVEAAGRAADAGRRGG